MAGCDRAELFAGNGMPREDRVVELECVDDGQNVIPKAIRGVACRFGRWGARSSKSTACDSVDVVRRGESECEFIEDMGGVSETR